jgi:hypothetical protein
MDFAAIVGLWWGMTDRKRITRLCTRMGIAMEDMVEKLLTARALGDEELRLMLATTGRTLARIHILLDHARLLADGPSESSTTSEH